MIATERETVITVSDEDKLVHIWTAQRPVINRMQKHPSFTLLKAGTYEGSPWAEFTIPADQWNPVTGAKRRSNLTDEQRAAAAERMRQVRQSKKPQ